MPNLKVGYQIHPQHCTAQQIVEAARAADSLGVDSIWAWDHMYPLYGDSEGAHHASTPLLAAIATATRHATVGALVAGNNYRNPEFYTYEMATIDQLSNGRAILGIGAGWFERDYTEYGYEFGDAPGRLRELRAALPRIRARMEKLHPPLERPMPIMIGGAGEKVTLQLTARHADMWNTFPPLDNWKRKNQVLNDWCQRVGRDPRAIERTCSINPDQFGELDQMAAAGVEHVILRGPQPFDMGPVEELLRISGH